MENLNNVLSAISPAFEGRSLHPDVFASSINHSGVVLKNEDIGNKIKNARNLKIKNDAADFGNSVDITTLTQIRTQIIEQKFYKKAPADYMPVVVGQGAFMEELLTYKSYSTADSFESGKIRTGQGELKTVDAQLDSVKTKLQPWAKKLGYGLYDIKQASKSGNWSLIESLEKARKTNWDLGIQDIAFKGDSKDSSFTGLYTNANVAINTSVITKSLSLMTAVEFLAFIRTVLAAYGANNNYIEYPDTFLIPISDFLGLGDAVSPDYPMISKRDYLENEFKKATGNPNFKIEGLLYGNSGEAVAGTSRYVLYRNNPDVLSMFLPIDYTSTVAGTYNGFTFESVAYGQYSGVEVFRPQEVLYFDF